MYFPAGIQVQTNPYSPTSCRESQTAVRKLYISSQLQTPLKRFLTITHLWGSVDYHPSFQQIAFFDEEAGECDEQQLNHSVDEPEHFYRDLQQRGIWVRVAMEATGYARWFAIGNIDGTQSSTHYVHINRQNIRTSQGGSEATILFDRPSDHARGVVRGIPGTTRESQAGVEGVTYQKG